MIADWCLHSSFNVSVDLSDGKESDMIATPNLPYFTALSQVVIVFLLVIRQSYLLVGHNRREASWPFQLQSCR